MSPLYEYECGSCRKLTCIMQQKPDGGPVSVQCEACYGRAYKVLSPVNWNLIPDGNPCLDPEPDELLPEQVK